MYITGRTRVHILHIRQNTHARVTTIKYAVVITINRRDFAMRCLHVLYYIVNFITELIYIGQIDCVFIIIQLKHSLQAPVKTLTINRHL